MKLSAQVEIHLNRDCLKKKKKLILFGCAGVRFGTDLQDPPDPGKHVIDVRVLVNIVEQETLYKVPLRRKDLRRREAIHPRPIPCAGIALQVRDTGEDDSGRHDFRRNSHIRVVSGGNQTDIVRGGTHARL